MQLALSLARAAGANDEVPVGAVLVGDGKVLGEGSNQPRGQTDPTAHAEIVALRQAATQLGNYRLVETTLYVTLEPCMMCAGALVHARINRLVFGATEPKAGCVSSHKLLNADWLNHQIEVTGGVCAAQCSELMQQFFVQRRGSR